MVITDIDRTIAANIRAELARRNLTARDLVDALGMDIRTVQRRLAGKAHLMVSDLFVISRVLDVEPSTLLPE